MQVRTVYNINVYSYSNQLNVYFPLLIHIFSSNLNEISFTLSVTDLKNNSFLRYGSFTHSFFASSSSHPSFLSHPPTPPPFLHNSPLYFILPLFALSPFHLNPNPFPILLLLLLFALFPLFSSSIPLLTFPFLFLFPSSISNASFYTLVFLSYLPLPSH